MGTQSKMISQKSENYFKNYITFAKKLRAYIS